MHINTTQLIVYFYYYYLFELHRGIMNGLFTNTNKTKQKIYEDSEIIRHSSSSSISGGNSYK